MVATANPSWEPLPLFARLSRLRANWPSRGWSWDTRVGCVSSSFVIDFEDQARAAAREAFAESWTHESIVKAPSRVKVAAARGGSIRPGQLVLASTDASGILVFGLWWPWANGLTTSLRVGLDIDETSDLHAHFRNLFGVTH